MTLTYQDFLESFEVNGWADGLPVVPPTPDKVDRLLDSSGRAGFEELDLGVSISFEELATIAVLAGCQPGHFPVVVAAARAHFARPSFAGRGDAALCVIVNGPARGALDIQCGPQCFGPGWPSNAAIGRALNLIVRQIEGSSRREVAFSTPDAYSFCFGEDEEHSPWEPLHVDRGFDRDQSTATVHSFLASLPSTDTTSDTPAGVLDTLADTLRSRPALAGRWPGHPIEPAFVVGTEQQRVFADANWSRAQIRDYLWSRLTESHDHHPALELGDPHDAPIVAAGGRGMSSIWVLVSDTLASATCGIDAARRD